MLQDHANERVPYSKIVFSWWYLTLALLFCIIANYLKRFSFCTNFPVHTSHITLTNLTQKLKKNWRFFVLYNSTAWIVAARDLTKDHDTDVTYYVLVCLQFLIRHRIVPHDLERNIKIYSLNIIFAYINSCAKVFFISLSWFLSSPSACRTSGASKNPEKYWLSWYFTPHYFANTLFNHLANTHQFWKPLRPQFATTKVVTK